MPEGNEQREETGERENRMEVNCNGHASTPESESSLEAQGTKQSTEEQEDQQNANQPESNKEAEDTLNNKEECQTCNGSTGDSDTTDLQQLSASLSPDSIAVELKEGDKEEKKEEEMDTREETNKEESSQNG